VVQPDSLRFSAIDAGKRIGTAVNTPPLGSEVLYDQTVRLEFSELTPINSMKWGPIHPTPTTWNFGPADTIVAFAERHGQSVKGHTLVWHSQLPAYMIDGGLSPTQVRAAMTNHITTLVGRYRGRVRAWDVVNEAMEDGMTGGYRNTVFFRAMGSGYIAEAFRLARAADPDAGLIYNDYLNDNLAPKSNRIFAMVAGLVDAGVPITSIGLQMHIQATDYDTPAELALLASNMARYRALGLKVNISELDVRIANAPGLLPSRLQLQRRVYHDVVEVCMREPACEGVTTWGFTDKYSWIDAFFGPDDPLLYDEQYVRKPAYWGVRDALDRR
jgi:GH35 family endo-1,4-beta-xylanase